VLHYGLDRCAGKFSSSGIKGAIVPDLALEETSPWVAACDGADVATVLLVAPSTPPERVDKLAAASQGFVYASARMAVTGASEGGGDGERVVHSIRRTSDVPALIGIGITSADQAKQAASVSDGAIVGSALVQVILNGGGATEVEAFIRGFRSAIDS